MTTDSITITFHKQFYTSGDVISGVVLKECLKPVNSKFLRITVAGVEETNWQSLSVISDKKKSSESNANVQHSSREEIFSVHTTLKGNEFSLEAGLNSFPFSFKLPPNCPPSFDGIHGRVRYSVKCELDRSEPWRFNDTIDAEFLVFPKVDLNSIYDANHIIDKNLCKNTGLLFKNGKVYVRAQLPRKGYTPGEDIPILIRIDNQSCKPTTRARAQLQQASRFTANTPASTRYYSETLETSEIECDVPAFRSDTILLNLRIPELTTASFESQLIHVSYKVTVTLETLSIFKGTLEWEFPIVIGTEPIGSRSTRPLSAELSAESLSISPPPRYEECWKDSLSLPPDYTFV